MNLYSPDMIKEFLKLYLKNNTDISYDFDLYIDLSDNGNINYRNSLTDVRVLSISKSSNFVFIHLPAISSKTANSTIQGIPGETLDYFNRVYKFKKIIQKNKQND